MLLGIDTTPIRWQRCHERCGCNRNPSRGDKSCSCRGGCERGSKDRNQRDAYAIDVLERLTGPAVNGYWECPITGLPFTWNDSETDRVVGGNGLYVPGNIILISKIANMERGYLQNRASDLPKFRQYKDDVLAASQGVRVRSHAEIRARKAKDGNYLKKRVSTVKGNGASVNVLSGPYA